jgi:hypothetical protein
MSCTLCRLTAVLVTLSLLLSTAPLAHAGDQDGIGGYSMKLKNKEYDGSYPGAGSSNVVVLSDKGLVEPARQSTSSTESMHSSLLSIIRVYWWLLFV